MPFVNLREIHSAGVGMDPVLMTEPVQLTPVKKLRLADITGEAETRRAAVTKVNCIMILGVEITQLLPKKWMSWILYES